MPRQQYSRWGSIFVTNCSDVDSREVESAGFPIVWGRKAKELAEERRTDDRLTVTRSYRRCRPGQRGGGVSLIQPSQNASEEVSALAKPVGGHRVLGSTRRVPELEGDQKEKKNRQGRKGSLIIRTEWRKYNRCHDGGGGELMAEEKRVEKN